MAIFGFRVRVKNRFSFKNPTRWVLLGSGFYWFFVEFFCANGD